jgi:hypothetical protein
LARGFPGQFFCNSEEGVREKNVRSFLTLSGIAGLLLLASASFAWALGTDDVRDMPVSEEDLRIIVRTGEILKDSTVWNRQDDRECTDDQRREKWSLYCALEKASKEVLGKYQHRRAAIQQVRLAIKELVPGRKFEHRLADYNNDPATTLPDIKRVLDIALKRIRHDLYGE